MRSLTLTTLAFLGSMQTAASASAEEGRPSPASTVPVASSEQTRGAVFDDAAPAAAKPVTVQTAPAPAAQVVAVPSLPASAPTPEFGLRLAPGQASQTVDKLKTAIEDAEDVGLAATPARGTPFDRAKQVMPKQGGDFLDQSAQPRQSRRLTLGSWFDSMGSFQAHVALYSDPISYGIVAMLAALLGFGAVRGVKRELAARKAAEEQARAGWTYRPFRG